MSGTGGAAGKGKKVPQSRRSAAKRRNTNAKLDDSNSDRSSFESGGQRDATTRRAEIAKLWVPNGVHCVKTLEARGYDELERRITSSYEKNVRDMNNVFRARIDARRLRDVLTFTWEMVPFGGENVLAVGLEVLQLDEDGRIIADYMFNIA